MSTIAFPPASGGGGTGGAVDSVNGNTGAVIITKTSIGLGSVDNTSDANKPISTATQTALGNKADKVTLAIASENISGHTVVSLGVSGTVQVCDSSAQVAVLGVSNNSAIVGGSIEIITNGLMTFAGWNFEADKPVFCNSTGQLTTTQPAVTYQTIVGVANSQTSLIINIQPQINIGA